MIGNELKAISSAILAMIALGVIIVVIVYISYILIPLIIITVIGSLVYFTVKSNSSEPKKNKKYDWE